MEEIIKEVEESIRSEFESYLYEKGIGDYSTMDREVFEDLAEDFISDEFIRFCEEYDSTNYIFELDLVDGEIEVNIYEI